MREGRDPTGKMPYRLWYEESEIDSIMEDELRKAGRRHSDELCGNLVSGVLNS
jgi:hypothetical protein